MKEIKELLDLIKAKREEKGISQREIADYLGISQPAYRNIENGQTSLKVETLYQIAQYLGINIFAQGKEGKEESLVAVNPADIFKNIGDLRKGQEDIKNEFKKNQEETNQKLDELLELFKKKKK